MSEHSMEIYSTTKIPAKPGLGHLHRAIVYCLVLLVLLFMIMPAAANVAAAGSEISAQPGSLPQKPDSSNGTGKTSLSSVLGAQTGSSSDPQQLGFTSSTRVATPGTITVRQTPTPLPTRRNQTGPFQIIAKNATERPKITVPVFWFGVVVTIAFIGLAAILYILLRGRQETAVPHKKSHEVLAGHATVIEGQAPQVREKSMEIQGPGDSFPPSLSKRFLNAEYIGEGGLARVFRAMNAKDGRIVAIKVPIRFDEVTGTHFARDIFFWQGLHHLNIIEIYSSNILPIPYVEMEYAPSSLAGLSLPLPEDKALEIIKGIARGIAYAHEKGIIHRDIKPENILITAEGTPKITDWGLGKEMSDVRKSSMIGFSPLYAAPEQISPHRYGKPGPATDIYQMGIVFYLMLTGRVPFTNEDMHEMSNAILHTAPPIPTWNGLYQKKIQPILMKCLEKRPEDRYDSAAILLTHLEAVSKPECNL
jgi:hypothetical protein